MWYFWWASGPSSAQPTKSQLLLLEVKPDWLPFGTFGAAVLSPIFAKWALVIARDVYLVIAERVYPANDFNNGLSRISLPSPTFLPRASNPDMLIVLRSSRKSKSQHEPVKYIPPKIPSVQREKPSQFVKGVTSFHHMAPTRSKAWMGSPTASFFAMKEDFIDA
jgi:hypothetical protein